MHVRWYEQVTVSATTFQLHAMFIELETPLSLFSYHVPPPLLLLRLLYAPCASFLLFPPAIRDPFRSYGPPQYKLPAFGVCIYLRRGGWGIVQVCLYRFFEKRFRLQYSIRRPRTERQWCASMLDDTVCGNAHSIFSTLLLCRGGLK